MDQISGISRPGHAATQDPPWTIGRLLQWVADDLRKRDIESPRLEAELLLSQATNLSRIQLIVDRDREPTPDQLTAFRALVQRRRRHEPIAYLMGQREFYGRTFRVDPRVLVPRPDTEALVEVALRRSQDRSMHGRLLDLCTGSGNVAVAIARERLTWQVDAVDISRGALDVAKDNAIRLGAVWNTRFLQGDLFQPVEGQTYDAVTSNPPYIPTGDIATLAADIRDHEPHLALDGGSDGLDVVRRIIKGAREHLRAGGLLALEVGCDQTEATSALMRDASFHDVQVALDLGQRPRVVSGLAP